MTWIRTVSPAEDPRVAHAAERQRALYPREYADPVRPLPSGELPGIVASHTLIPDALYHAFATFGSLLSPDLPLTRAQHEMIATVVSAENRCAY
jgi:alkylhydroperoxidase family enzyme